MNFQNLIYSLPFKNYLRFLLFLAFFSISVINASPFEETKNLPVAFQGRYRSLDSAARLSLYDFYHQQQLKKEDLSSFLSSEKSALELQWKMHFLGSSFMDNAPFFWIQYYDIKNKLGLDPLRSRFSYNELYHALFNNKEVNLRVMQIILPYEYAKTYLSPVNRSANNKQELRNLSTGLWVQWQSGNLIVTAAPETAPWNYLKSGMILKNGKIDLEKIEKENKLFTNEILQLLQHLNAYKNISNIATNPSSEEITNINHVLQTAGTTLKMVPSKLRRGEWLSLHTLNLKIFDPNIQQYKAIENFTIFSDEAFAKLQNSYKELSDKALAYYKEETLENNFSLNHAVHTFTENYNLAYASIVSQPYQETINKQLFYPTHWQLNLETLYYRLPLIEISFLIYSIALVIFLVAYTTKKKSLSYCAVGLIACGLILHSLILALRCFILQRPPVSNMFETVIYVPWIAMLLGIGLFALFRNSIVLIAATISSVILLILLKLANVDGRMENVQAVLDSQYWLIVHVLMIVGSYGVFIVCGVLAHFYLIACALGRQNSSSAQFTANCILQTMYIGVALLIPGTILGGVWAAESWGRFWDWDPKESWAFISACVYVFVIHAYTFKTIREYGLAIGAIAGMMAISFTWYGVNYILGTGLHSYGFGNGGELYYYGYLAIESIFLFAVHSIISFTKKNKASSLFSRN